MGAILVGGRVTSIPDNWSKGFVHLNHPARIYRMRRGSLEITWKGGHSILKSPGMYWVPAMERSFNLARQDFAVDFLHLDDALLHDFPNKKTSFAFSPLEDEYWAPEWEDALAHPKKRNLPEHKGLLAMVTSLVRRLNHHVSLPAPTHKRRRLQPLVEELEGNPEVRLSLPQMAELVHLSIGHFSRLFKEAMGTSPQSYQRERLMNHLSSRISRGESLKKIASEISYSSPFALSRDFKKHFGISPREYLQIYQKQS